MEEKESVVNMIGAELDAAEAKKSKKKKMLKKVKCFFAIVIIAAICGIVAICAVQLEPKYKQATELYTSGEIQEAYNIYKELGFYKDSRKICNQYEYSLAQDCYAIGQYAKSYYILANINSCKEAKTLAAQIKEEYPYVEILTKKEGETVFLGEYEQDNNIVNGAEPIEWIVLENKNGMVKLISRYILDAKAFNTNNVYDCSLDEWLNDEFYETAFADVIEENILYLTLFSYDDYQMYSKNADDEIIKTEPTQYAKGINTYKEYVSSYYYWLSGELSENRGYVQAYAGKENGGYANTEDVIRREGVRPVLWFYTEEEPEITTTYSGATPRPYKKSSSKSSSSKKTTNKCIFCNGTGYVKYYSGNDYTYGTCTSCNGTGISTD